MKVRKCIIPVAGLGTRFLPITKSVAKEMLPIIDRPTIEYIVKEAIDSGIEEILFITNPYKKILEDYFDHNYELEDRLKKNNKEEQLNLIKDIPNMCKFYYMRQGNPLGTGHAIKICEDFINNEPFAIMYGDDIIDSKVPALKQMIDIYNKKDCNVMCAYTVSDSEVSSKGIISYANDDLLIKDLVEKPKLEEAPSNDATLGRYILKPSIFKYLKNIQLKKGEYLLTDAMLEAMKDEPFYACKVEGTYFDVGSKSGYVNANINYALKNEQTKKEVKEYIDSIM